MAADMNVSMLRRAEMCEQKLKFVDLGPHACGAMNAPETASRLDSWAGFYEGYFVLKKHGHEKRVSESFVVWRSETMLTACKNDSPFFYADATLPASIEAEVSGVGQNIYGRFLLRGALFVDGYLRLERSYVGGEKKRARQIGASRERRLIVPLVARSSTREKRPTTQFDNSAPSSDYSSSCDESNRRRRKLWSETIQGEKASSTLSECDDKFRRDHDGTHTSRGHKFGSTDHRVSADSSDISSSEDDRTAFFPRLESAFARARGLRSQEV